MKLLNVTIMSGENGFTKAMRSVCDEYEEISTGLPGLNERILAVTSADLVFIQIQATGILPESVAWLKSLGAYIIQWSGDKRDGLPHWYVDMASWGVDMSCFSNMADVRTMRTFGYEAEFLQIGADPDIYKPDGELCHAPEIVFMGNNCGGFPLSQYRQEMISFLKTNYGERFGVYGSGWAGFDSGNYNGDQYGEAAVYRSAKIGINLSHFDTDSYTSDRLFRMLLSGVCVLSYHIKNRKNEFSPGIWYWRDFDGLKFLIDKLLINDIARVHIANNGHELGLEKYTFKSMAENIITLWKTHAS